MHEERLFHTQLLAFFVELDLAATALLLVLFLAEEGSEEEVG